MTPPLFYTGIGNTSMPSLKATMIFFSRCYIFQSFPSWYRHPFPPLVRLLRDSILEIIKKTNHQINPLFSNNDAK